MLRITSSLPRCWLLGSNKNQNDQWGVSDQDWSLAESDTDAIQLERIGASNQHHTGRGSKLTKLNRKTLKDAVIYSEILKPKYQSK